MNVKYIKKIVLVVGLFFVLASPYCSAGVNSAITEAQKKVDAVITSQAEGDMVSETDPNKIANNILMAVMGIIGSITLLMFVYNGIMWMTALGNPKKVDF
ncbi:MAG: hypothetical protein WCT18_03525, partial [Patescibacteria group bacterium]